MIIVEQNGPLYLWNSLLYLICIYLINTSVLHSSTQKVTGEIGWPAVHPDLPSLLYVAYFGPPNIFFPLNMSPFLAQKFPSVFLICINFCIFDQLLFHYAFAYFNGTKIQNNISTAF